MRKLTIGLCCTIALMACDNNQELRAGEEDLRARSLLRGIRIKDGTGLPLVRIEGDIIHYTNPQNTPISLKIIRDTVYAYGNNTAACKIGRQTEYSFQFHPLMDEIVKLYKSESPEDILVFESKEVEAIPITEIIKRDSVVMYRGIRYRGYVYINPSKMKVIRTSCSEDGINVDNVYYDNVAHIYVYEDRQVLYSRDITEKMLAGISPTGTPNQVVLADVNSMGVNNKGYQYQVTLCVPESSICGLANITIGFDNQMSIKKAE